jgi:hypothetical protein
MVGVTFEAVSFCTSTLRESVFVLLKTFLELLFWNALQDGRRMSAMSENLWPFKAVFSFGNNQKLHGAKSGEYGGWSNFIIDFLARNSWTASIMSKGIVMMQDLSIRPKFRSSLMNSLT